MSQHSSSPKSSANGSIFCLPCSYELKREVIAADEEKREVNPAMGVASAFTWQAVQNPGSLSPIVIPVCFRHLTLPNASGLLKGNDVLGL